MTPSWQPIETVPKDRYVLLFTPRDPRWAGNMDVGKWFGGDGDDMACFWSRGGPNGGLELNGDSQGTFAPFTHWMELPDDAT